MEIAGFPLEIKNLSEGGEIVGFAAAFGNLDHGGDIIEKGAFAETLAQHKAAGTAPAMLLHHDMSRPIGRWTELSETEDGLLAKGKITRDCTDGAEAYALARDGALGGLSVGYGVKVAGRRGDARLLQQLELHEASLVAVPMNAKARIVTVKSIGNIRELEDLLRSGLSGRKARVAANAAWAAINSTEPNNDDELAAILSASINRLSTI
ncbi:hypothetical protein A9995_00745 [Erythrobacter sp. QSSC1-22B]|uniref:HK97 family phage prohead protease n=1 Tax=Erythrobacter sp. QSSC1-22B TaxID=1860125 RepID=UPI0008050B8E|nr:HK97 family phage prohead protease [Erythrobacter sp. QSSC1-22B]OBX20293.1 hypothetical protein A9995_00745 [Erythrobacter sp. QSSC1-22B]